MTVVYWFFGIAVLLLAAYLVPFGSARVRTIWRESTGRPMVLAFGVALFLSGILLLVAVYVVKAQSPAEYQKYVVFSEEFDLVAENKGTVTQRLKDKVLAEADTWNHFIDVTNRDQTNAFRDFSMKDFVNAQKVLTEKLR